MKGLPVVAIGASAGGIQAMTRLLNALPDETGMAYVYIQHLNPDLKSDITEIFARATSMKVTEALQDTLLEKNCLYIIPPGQDMAVSNGRLSLANRSKTDNGYMPIDKFFLSLANQKEGAIAIILSGAAHDGSIGMRSVKEAGGLTFAQDSSAEFESMPHSAIHDGVVDKVLSPEQMAEELIQVSRGFEIFTKVMNDDLPKISDNEEDLQPIIQLIRRKMNVDFTHYKVNTIRRRIYRRMVLHKKPNLNQYLAFIKSNPEELQQLFNDLLINVTSFFRDGDTNEYLRKLLLPQILKAKRPGDPVRIWVAACSTGQEAYSLAMILTEMLGYKTGSTPIQIFATDLSENMITKARLGMFNRNEVEGISTERLNNFFTRIEGGYRVVKSVRDMCVFAPHNIFRDPPFSRIDIVSCCNLMIYLDPVLQKKILNIFHYSLNAEGFLVLGKSESIGDAHHLFSLVEKSFKVYRKNDHKINKLDDIIFESAEQEPLRKTKDAPPKAIKDTHGDMEKSVDDLLLSKYVPACVVVNQDLDILHFKGSTGIYLEPSPGKASLNLLKMAKPGLAFDIKTAVHKSNKNGENVRKSNIEMKNGNDLVSVSIEVIPLTALGKEKTFLVIFEMETTGDSKSGKGKLGKDKGGKKLGEELMAAREDMRSIIEEQQASNEELQSANEEIVSSNEELHSINEELETSREEVESANEELMTINAELQVRNEQLTESYEYAEAVFDTISESIVILDKYLRVKTANDSFYKTFNLRAENTEGSLIFELGKGEWETPEFRDLFTRLLKGRGSLKDVKINWQPQGEPAKQLLVNATLVLQKIHQKEIIMVAIEDISYLKTVID